AIATGPGEFLGKEAVEGRAADLAKDLARAIKEKRRYPATDRDLRFYQFMGALVKSEKDTLMKHDFKHWQEHGFYDSFEKYIQQSTTEVSFDQGVRDAWIKEMIQEQKAKKSGKSAIPKKEPGAARPLPKTCRELIQSMPQGFQPEAAGDLTAKLQFEVQGEENFVSHLKIAGGACTYQEGPADKPNLIIKTPADVWLKISRGELSGQKAFMEGQYKVEGDMTLLMKLNRLFSA
ncbi:MAG TPA: SCP2 sterol-binding domain-containing protein, partial [Thermodesulfobacteriota bacterium]|nr:SCP2 sterol-binding domain-containing protein [Thermodesulfobacteriota bacterium]